MMPAIDAKVSSGVPTLTLSLWCLWCLLSYSLYGPGVCDAYGVSRCPVVSVNMLRMPTLMWCLWCVQWSTGPAYIIILC